MSTTNQDPAGDDVLALPWYATGRLDAAEMRRIEGALARDPALAREYDLVREEIGATIHVNETLGAPSAQAMGRLFDAIDREPVRTRRARAMGAWFAGLVAGVSPRGLAWSAGIAAVVLLLQAGLIADLAFAPGGAAYRTASAPGAPSVAGSFALIRFAPATSEAAVTAFLLGHQLSISGGPFPGGLYRVRLGAAGMSREDRAAAIERLQGDPVVGFIADAD